MENKKELLRKYAEGKTTAEESLLIEQWFNQLNSGEKLTIEKLDELSLQLDNKIKGTNSKPKVWGWVAAASVLIFCSLLANYFFFNFEAQRAVYTEIAQIKAPQANGVEILFDNGEKLSLAKLKAGDTWTGQGHKFLKLATGEYKHSTAENSQAVLKFTIQALKGGMAIFDLSDGSKVWINENTELEVPSDFESMRRVRLDGEAYFRIIAKNNEAGPATFRVLGKEKDIEVLGTEFNAKFGKLSQIYLEKGKIALTKHADDPSLISEPIVMSPNEFFNGSQVVVMDNPTSILAWKDDRFNLTQFNLGEFASILSEWYDVEIQIEPELANRQLYGMLSRRLSLKEVLDAINKVIPISYSLKQNKIYITDQSK